MFTIIRNKIPKDNKKYWIILKINFVFNNSIVNIDNKTTTLSNIAKLFQLPTKLPDVIPLKNPGRILLKPINISNNSKITIINPPINRAPRKYHKRFSDWKWIEDKKKTIKSTSIDPNVPTSNPLPKSETYSDEEKNDEIRKTNGIAPANKINLSLGKINLPSPSRETNQKKRESVAPIERRNPLLASRVTET